MSDITENRVKVNKFLNNLYKYIKHYFRYVDREMFFSESESEINNTKFATKFARLLQGYKYILYTNKCVPSIDGKYNLSWNQPTVAGLYFPNNSIGDKIDIIIRNYVFSIIITDTNKIYLPIDDEYFLHCNQIPYNEMIIRTNKVFYLVSVHYLKSTFMFSPFVYFLQNKKKYLQYKDGECILIDKPTNLYIYQEDEIGSAIIIQRAWKRYKNRWTQYYTKWSNHIEEVNTEIRLLPDIGIEYFNALNEFIFYSKTI